MRQRVRPTAVTLLLLVTMNLLSFVDRFILPGELSLIQEEFHTTQQQMGALTTALFLVYMLAAPLTGWLGDRFSRKPLIVSSVLFWSLATLAAGWVHDYWALYFRHALVAVGEASFAVFAPTVIADMYSARERSRILSIYYAAIPIGGALGYVAGGQIGTIWGWRQPFCICAIPGLVVATLYAILGREPVRGGHDLLGPKADRASFWSLFRNPAFLCATFGIAELAFATGGIANWLPYFLHNSVGLSVAQASLIAGSCTIVNGILGTIVGGWIAQRWLRTNHRALYLLSFWSLALMMPFCALLFLGPSRWAVPSLFAAEFFLYLITGPINTAVLNSVSAQVRATAISVSLFCIHFFGDTFSPQIIGAIADRSSLRIGLSITLVPVGISCILLLIGSRFAPRHDDDAFLDGNLTSNLLP